MGRIEQLLRARVIDPLLRLLRQGATPPALALSMSVGAVIGIFPLLGSTTLICLALAFALRLNPVAMQALNWLVYPLQILCIVPFIQIGQRWFSAAPIELSLAQLQAAFAAGWLAALLDLWRLLLGAALVWSAVSIPLGLVLYQVFVRLLRRAPDTPP